MFLQDDGNLVILQAEVKLSKQALEQAETYCSWDVSISSRQKLLFYTSLVCIM